DNITEVPAALESLAAGRTGPILALEVSDEYREREFDPEKGASAYVNIMSGCDNFCAYCIVPFTRGRQKSRRMADILEECRKRLEEGAREIILLGQNVNAWGKDLFSGETFASLLDRIAVYKDLERLRFVSVHPADMDDECVEMFAKWEKICPRLHLPLQSGSNRVLKKMRRRYTAEEYMRLVEKLRSARPDLALSTDLIVGFPGETEEDFRETLDIMKKSAFLASYSFCYSDRPGVRASLMPDKIPDEIKGDRLIRLQALQEEIGQELLRLRTGGETEALIEARSPRQVAGKISWQGRDPYGVAIHLELSDPNPAGKVVRVRITAAKKHSLIGEPVN
ncbi:MAG: MiaB/RimO family radical SAM methylthiotransferase, partial [Desulfovibrio sp.]|nr:MiaB/RimO family radical SAM methylthiotransferase [Desulfovibrio sp.]